MPATLALLDTTRSTPSAWTAFGRWMQASGLLDSDPGRCARWSRPALDSRMSASGRPSRAHLLIATPTLLDPNFHRTVVLLLEHTDEGALGVVLNRPSETARPAAAVPDLARGR